MSGLQTGTDVVGIAKQSAKGTIATQPAFAFGITGGGIKVSPTQEPVPVTSAYTTPAGAYREKVEETAQVDTLAWYKAIGLLLLGILGDVDSSGGAPAVKAVYVTALTGTNNDLTFTAKTAGVAGNSITVALVDPAGNDQALDVTVASTAISVSLATGSGGAITSTAAEVRAAINADTEAKALIVASLAPANDGSGVVTALTAKNLAGGADAGSGGSYTHVFTKADPLPYLSVFEKKGDGTILGLKDCKVDELEISWEENKPPDVKAKVNGGILSFPASFTPTVDETDTTDYFTPVGGTFKYDVDSDTPVTASVLGGKIVIKHDAEAKFYSGSIEASDVLEGNLTGEVSLAVNPADLDEWRTLITGADNGASVADEPVYGSLEVTLTQDASTSLKIAVPRVAFLYDLPDGNPDGGAAEVEVSGAIYRDGATSPVTATLKNAQAAY